MSTNSEKTITAINQNIFYKEFTFDKNEFYPTAGEQKEVADNIIVLDELLFIIQIKGRNEKDVKSCVEENKWFDNVVLKKAKKQIKDSLGYFKTQPRIPITNGRGHTVDVSKISVANSNNIIVYAPNSMLLSKENRAMKFYVSNDVGYIHLFHVEDYFWVCKYLITPTELDEYLKFRIEICTLHTQLMSIYPEQYILAHFLNSHDPKTIDETYIETFEKFVHENESFDLSSILSRFFDNIHSEEQRNNQDYYHVIKEIAKLKRYELKEFKGRLVNIINAANANESVIPLRFTNNRTGCGFVFISLADSEIPYWENALINFTTLYKYKKQLDKCIGVIVYKKSDYFDFNWAYMYNKWEYDKLLEDEVNKDAEIYGLSEIIEVERYKFRS